MERKQSKEHYRTKCSKWVFILIAIMAIILITSLWLNTGIENLFCCFLNLMGADENKTLCYMRKEMSFTGTAVVTMFSIFATLVAFYYNSMIDSNYGIKNREIIGYVYGSNFILFLISANAFTIFCMFCGFYTHNYVLFYLCALYAFFLLGFLIYLTIFATFKKKCAKAILLAERMQYRDLCKETLAEKSPDEILEYMIEAERSLNVNPYNCKSILEGKEAMPDKLKLINEIFLIPFSAGSKRKRVIRKFNSSSHPETKFCGYFYLYHNLLYLADRINQAHNEADEIISGMNEYAKELFPVSGNKSDNQATQENCLTYFGAFLIAFLPMIYDRASGVIISDKVYAFLKSSFNTVVTDQKLRVLLLLEYIHALTYLWYLKKIDFKDDKFTEAAKVFVQGIEINDRTVEEADKDTLLRYEAVWLTCTTERVNINKTLSRSESDIYYQGGDVSAINFLYSMKWDYLKTKTDRII